MTNLQSWAELFGLPALADYLSTRQFLDHATLVAGFANTSWIIFQGITKPTKIKRRFRFWSAVALQVVSLVIVAIGIFYY
jgi:hypothetical protein